MVGVERRKSLACLNMALSRHSQWLLQIWREEDGGTQLTLVEVKGLSWQKDEDQSMCVWQGCLFWVTCSPWTAFLLSCTATIFCSILTSLNMKQPFSSFQNISFTCFLPPFPHLPPCMFPSLSFLSDHLCFSTQSLQQRKRFSLIQKFHSDSRYPVNSCMTLMPLSYFFILVCWHPKFYNDLDHSDPREAWENEDPACLKVWYMFSI